MASASPALAGAVPGCRRLARGRAAVPAVLVQKRGARPVADPDPAWRLTPGRATKIFAFQDSEALIHNANSTVSSSLKANAKILIYHCRTNRGLAVHRHLFLRYGRNFAAGFRIHDGRGGCASEQSSSV